MVQPDLSILSTRVCHLAIVVDCFHMICEWKDVRELEGRWPEDWERVNKGERERERERE